MNKPVADVLWDDFEIAVYKTIRDNVDMNSYYHVYSTLIINTMPVQFSTRKMTRNELRDVKL